MDFRIDGFTHEQFIKRPYAYDVITNIAFNIFLHKKGTAHKKTRLTIITESVKSHDYNHIIMKSLIV